MVLEQLKHQSTKIQEVTLNVVITLLRKMKNHVSHRCQGPKGHFQIELLLILIVLQMS